MSTTIADPLFVRAEVEYRSQTWGVTEHRPQAGAVSPVRIAGLLRRLVARPTPTSRPATSTTAAAAVRRPRHP